MDIRVASKIAAAGIGQHLMPRLETAEAMDLNNEELCDAKEENKRYSPPPSVFCGLCKAAREGKLSPHSQKQTEQRTRVPTRAWRTVTKLWPRKWCWSIRHKEAPCSFNQMCLKATPQLDPAHRDTREWTRGQNHGKGNGTETGTLVTKKKKKEQAKVRTASRAAARVIGPRLQVNESQKLLASSANDWNLLTSQHV